MAVLADTSVWIGALSRPSLRKALGHLIREDGIVIARPILAEFCQGLRDEVEFRSAWDAMSAYPILEIKPEHWRASAFNYLRCRKRGITPTMMDCLIATLAREYSVPVWTLDRGFGRMAPVIGFDRADPESGSL